MSQAENSPPCPPPTPSSLSLSLCDVSNFQLDCLYQLLGSLFPNFPFLPNKPWTDLSTHVPELFALVVTKRFLQRLNYGCMGYKPEAKNWRSPFPTSFCFSNFMTV